MAPKNSMISGHHGNIEPSKCIQKEKGYITKAPTIFYIQSMVFTLLVLVLSVVTFKPLSGHRGADQTRIRLKRSLFPNSIFK